MKLHQDTKYLPVYHKKELFILIVVDILEYLKPCIISPLSLNDSLYFETWAVWLEIVLLRKLSNFFSNYFIWNFPWLRLMIKGSFVKVQIILKIWTVSSSARQIIYNPYCILFWYALMIWGRPYMTSRNFCHSVPLHRHPF